MDIDISNVSETIENELSNVFGGRYGNIKLHAVKNGTVEILLSNDMEFCFDSKFQIVEMTENMLKKLEIEFDRVILINDI